MKFSLIALVSILGSIASAHAGTVTCEAHGKSVSNLGQPPLYGEALITFTDFENAAGLRVISNITGTVKAGSDELPMTKDNSYIGSFNISQLQENPNYRPNRYKGYSQFRNFDATETTGLERGMWGSLVVEKDTTKKNFNAEYIFQAGDHMGGTVHLTCQSR